MTDPLPIPASLLATLAAYQLFSTAEPDPDLWNELKSAVIDLDHVTNLAGPIVRTLATIEDGRFCPDDFGEVVLVIAAHGEDAETVVDLVAWSARYPEIFGSMFGEIVLGVDYLLNPATYVAGPCRLFTNPLTWLKGGCAGVVILNYAEAGPLLETAQGPFTTDTMDHALDLFRSGVVPSNRLWVPSDWRIAA